MDDFSKLFPALIVASCLSASVIHFFMESLDFIRFFERFTDAIDANDFTRSRNLATAELKKLKNLKRFVVIAMVTFLAQIAITVPFVCLGTLPRICLYTLVVMPCATAVLGLRRLATEAAAKKADELLRRPKKTRNTELPPGNPRPK